jgi:hypothetical protein
MPDNIPMISEAGRILLEIALKRDRHKQLVKNPAVHLCLDCLRHLPETSAKGRQALTRQFRLDTWPSSVFRFCAALLNYVDHQLIPLEGMTADRWSRHSEYDHPALLALGQTVARAAGIRRAKGPTLNEALKLLSKTSAVDLQRSFLQNYLGNILQDQFDACEVRRNVHRLPADREDLLRTEDARKMADWLIVGDIVKNGAVAAGPLESRMKTMMVALFFGKGHEE